MDCYNDNTSTTISRTERSARTTLLTRSVEHLSPGTSTMSAEKRAATDGFGSHQIVKRQKSDNNLNNSVAVVNGGAQNGALIQSVCPILHSLPHHY